MHRAISVGVQMTCGCVTDVSGTAPCGTLARNERRPAVTATALGHVAHVRSGSGCSCGCSGVTGGGSAGTGLSGSGSKMISLRIGPILPARSRPAGGRGVGNTRRTCGDGKGGRSNERTFDIGITPRG